MSQKCCGGPYRHHTTCCDVKYYLSLHFCDLLYSYTDYMLVDFLGAPGAVRVWTGNARFTRRGGRKHGDRLLNILPGVSFRAFWGRFPFLQHRSLNVPFMDVIRAKRVSNCYMQEKKKLTVCVSGCSVNLGFSVRSANRIRPKHGIPLPV